MSAPTWNLSNIRAKTRAITGSPDSDSLSDSDLNDYINKYYVYEMPFELKEQITDQFLKFKTTPGINVYSFPTGYFTDQPGAYADGFPLVFYQDPDVFYQDWPLQYAVDNIATGDGATVNFPGGLQNPPVVVGSLFITADNPDGSQQVLQADDTFPVGLLTGDGSGTINWLTGAYNVTFTAAPASSAYIYAKYQGYSSNRPQGILFFNNEFTLMPVPDQAYQIQMQGYIQPLYLADTAVDGVSTTTPLQMEWGQLIAYGAALDIFASRGDTENYDRYYPIFKRMENIALGRTIQQITAEQSVPRF